MKRRWYITAGTLTFLLAMVLLAPAASLSAWLAPKQAPATIELFGVQGTVGSGQAAGLNISGHPALSNLQWSLRSWRLLLGQLAFQLQSGGDTALEGRVGMSLFGTTSVDNLHSEMGIKALLSAIGQPYLPVDGKAALDMDSVRVRKQKIKSADGKIEIHNLAWTLASEPIELGGLTATISTESGAVLVKIEPLPGALEISGDAKLTVSDQSYQAHLQLRPKPDANPLIRNLLSSAGEPDGQGWYHLRRQGILQ